MQPLAITVAGVGAELSLADQPNLPVTPEALARDAAECREAGASIYHLHVRDASGQPTMAPAAFRAAHDAIARATDLIVQFTTGGAVGDADDARVAPLDLRPEMATLTTGSVNFGDEVFWNPTPLVQRLYARMLELGVLPEYEIFEPGMIATAGHLYETLGADHHRHYDFVLAVPGAMPAWADSLSFLASHLPAEATWSATGIGRAFLDVCVAAIDAGGHVRTGFEDVRYLGHGEPARSNAQLVRKVAEVAGSRGRPVADPTQVRQMLGL